MSEVFASVVSQLSVGLIGGFLAGYAIKKVAKLIAVVLGLYLLSLLCLTHVGVIRINYEKFIDLMSMLVGMVKIDILPATISCLPLAVSFISGFVLGIKKG